MGVWRATLYRSVPTKEHLLALLFERMTAELGAAAELVASDPDRNAHARLHGLVAVHIDAAVRMRHYLFVFFEGGRLPSGTNEHWRRWQKDYERLWLDTVAAAAAAGLIRTDDPAVATRLLLGVCIWVSHWYRPGPRSVRRAARWPRHCPDRQKEAKTDTRPRRRCGASGGRVRQPRPAAA